MNKLPDKPSEILEVALKDLEACEKDPNYDIEMLDWHSPYSKEGACTVCLAGAVMAKTLEADKEEFYTPASIAMDITGEWMGDKGYDVLNAKLISLNAYRVFGARYYILELNKAGFKHRLPDTKNGLMPDYSDDPASFKHRVRQDIEILKQMNQ